MDERKARANLERHGVGFAEAATIVDNPRGLAGEDIRHSTVEARRIRLAMSSAVSARRAGRRQRACYAEA